MNFRHAPLLLLTLLLAFAATALGKDKPKFLSVWKGEGEGGSRMTLRMFSPLPTEPTEGWLNSPEGAEVAAGDFKASRTKPARFGIVRGPVIFQAEKRGENPVGRYSIEDGVLTICMLSIKPGVYDGRAGVPITVDYATCATMHEVKK